MRHKPIVLIMDRTNGMLYTMPTPEDSAIMYNADCKPRYMVTRFGGRKARYCCLFAMLQAEKRDARICLDMATAKVRNARPLHITNACYGLPDEEYMRIYGEKHFTIGYAPPRGPQP